MLHDVRAKGDGSLVPVKRTWRTADGTEHRATYWRASVTVDGRRHERQVATKAEGREALRDLLRRKEAGTVDGSRLLLRTYLEDWLVDVRPNLAPATWRKHEQHIRNHLAPAMGHRRLSELSVGDVRRYLLAGSNTHHAQTLRHHRATLRRALADAVRDGLLTRNVAALAEPPKLDTKERPVLTAEQVRVLIDGTRNDTALWTLLATTGLREAEALALTWEDIDLDTRAAGGVDATGRRDDRGEMGDRGIRSGVGLRDNRGASPCVRVTRTLHRVPRSGDTPGYWEFRPTKTAKSRRTVFLPAVTVEVLRQHKARQMERWLADGKPGDGQMVFTDTKGRPIHGANLSGQMLRPVLERLGLPRVRTHDLRHSAATIMYAAGVPLEGIADMLGHSTVRVTQDLYRHRVEAVQRDAADAMERALTRGVG